MTCPVHQWSTSFVADPKSWHGHLHFFHIANPLQTQSVRRQSHTVCKCKKKKLIIQQTSSSSRNNKSSKKYGYRVSNLEVHLLISEWTNPASLSVMKNNVQVQLHFSFKFFILISSPTPKFIPEYAWRRPDRTIFKDFWELLKYWLLPFKAWKFRTKPQKVKHAKVGCSFLRLIIKYSSSFPILISDKKMLVAWLPLKVFTLHIEWVREEK